MPSIGCPATFVSELPRLKETLCPSGQVVALSMVLQEVVGSRTRETGSSVGGLGKEYCHAPGTYLEFSMLKARKHGPSIHRWIVKAHPAQS